MRVILIKQASDLQALTTRLIGKKSAAASSAALDHLKALNPHVDFNRIEAGTVLLLPDTPDIKADDRDSHSIADDTFEDLSRHMKEGFGAAAARVAKATDDLAADRSAVASAVKTAPVKRLIESDALLKKQLDEANEVSNAELKKLKDAAKQVETMWKAAGEELAALGQLLR